MIYIYFSYRMVYNYGLDSRDFIDPVGDVLPNEPILRQQAEAYKTAARLTKSMENPSDIADKTPVEAPSEDVNAIKVGEKVYLYSTWQDLFDQLEEHGVSVEDSVEEIWENCHGKNPEITLENFYREALKNLGDKKSQLWKHYGNQLIIYLRQQDGGDILVDDIWIRCKEIYPNLERRDFWPIALNDWGFPRYDIQALQDKVDGADDNDDRRPGFYY